MAFISRCHPLLVHFPIALVLAAAIGAAMLSSRRHGASRGSAFAYRFMLFVTALLVTVTAHSGGTLVWGDGFFRL
jgi:uncharacterized membrane protein